MKNLLKRFLPPPTKIFYREIQRLLDALEHVNSQMVFLNEHAQEMVKNHTEINLLLETSMCYRDKQYKELQRVIEIQSDKIKQLQEQTKQLQEQIQQSQEETKTLQEQVNTSRYDVEKVRKFAQESARNSSEIIWAEVFNNTIADSDWLKNTSFSPGRWAVGYQYLYVMYRVLNETHPLKILELGLGQSTRMIAQYAAINDNVKHYVVEQDYSWIEFFKNNFPLSSKTKLMLLDYEMSSYKEAKSVRVYKGFKECFEKQKFDFISIDAPLGGDMKQYSRIDILQLLPGCLSDNFVIMLDDCERSGEHCTLAEIEKILTKNSISYKRGNYMGKKDCVLLCAEHLGFLTSM